MRKRFVLLLIITSFSFLFCFNKVLAVNDNRYLSVDNYGSYNMYFNDNIVIKRLAYTNNGDEKCESIFGTIVDGEFTEDSLGYWINWILNIMKYVGVVALVALSTFDFFKAFVQNDKDALKNAGTKSFKRLIYAILIFFIPIIINILMKLFGANGTCGIG